ncbi:MAG: hypothetical protein ACI4TI_02830 [Christensenellales bacterium]
MNEIENDLFDIVKKIKEINPCYRVFRNIVKHRYEIYSKHGENLTLEVVCPYDTLDYRIVNLINKTKVEHADEIFDEIETSYEKMNGGM